MCASVACTFLLWRRRTPTCVLVQIRRTLSVVALMHATRQEHTAGTGTLLEQAQCCPAIAILAHPVYYSAAYYGTLRSLWPHCLRCVPHALCAPCIARPLGALPLQRFSAQRHPTHPLSCCHSTFLTASVQPASRQDAQPGQGRVSDHTRGDTARHTMPQGVARHMLSCALGANNHRGPVVQCLLPAEASAALVTHTCSPRR